MAKEGASVVILSRTTAEIEESAKMIQAAGGAGSQSLLTYRRSARKSTFVASAMWYNKTSAAMFIRILNTEASAGMTPLA